MTRRVRWVHLCFALHFFCRRVFALENSESHALVGSQGMVSCPPTPAGLNHLPSLAPQEDILLGLL